MQKLKLTSNVRMLLILLSGIFSIGFAILWYIQPQEIDTNVVEKEVFNYTIDKQVDYAVGLLPNPIYTESQLLAGLTYLKAFTNTLESTYNITFTGSESAQFTADYELLAYITSYTTQRQEKQDIWSKQYTLKAQQHISDEGTTFHLTDTVKINYPSYVEIANQLSEMAKTTAPTELRLSLVGTITCKTPYQEITQPLEVTLNVPLNESYFNMTATGIESISDTLTENYEMEIPIENQTTKGYLVGSIVLALIFFYILIGTQKATKKDLAYKKLKKLFNAYSNRMVGVTSFKEDNYINYYTVTEFYDLVKLSDDLENPILYVQSEDLLNVSKFYVAHADTLYVFHQSYTE